MTVFAHRRVRVLRAVRTAHLERAHDLVPASIVYSRTRSDFDPAVAGGLDMHRLSTPATVLALLRRPVDVLEVTEPLARYGVWRACAAVLAVRAGDRARRRHTLVGTYAIENRNVFEGAPSTASAARRRVERQAARWLLGEVDRVAYGTEGARDTYAEVFGDTLGAHAPAQRVIAGVPAPCACPAAVLDGDVLYLGGLVERKGFDRLAGAWPAVVAADPAARLTIVGTGALEPAARALGKAYPGGVELLVAASRRQIHTLLRRHRVLVLPSRRIPNYWREQIGLPILEALAHGLTVVTTDETGLAGWLSAHGHHVIAADADVGVLAAALLDARARRRPAEDVVGDLPPVDGRLAADRWLFDSAPRAGAPDVVHDGREVR